MRAVCWCDRNKVRVEQVEMPRIINPRDILIRITATTVCGSDLHLYDGMIPGMAKGDILGHEPVGEVVEVGSAVRRHKVGDRVMVISIIGCGECWYCKNQQFSLCDNSNPNAAAVEKLYGYSPAGIFGYTHLFGGYAGGQAEYLRVPFADVGAFKLPGGMSDAAAVACTDAFPTGYMAADLANITPGSVVAVWGCGPVGLFAMKSAWLMGAHNVIAIDSVRHRLDFAARMCNATQINVDEVNVTEALRDITGGRGVDCCIDAVGMEAHGADLLAAVYDRVKQATWLANDRLHVVRQMIESARKGGTLSIVGVYALLGDKFPLGAAFNKGLRFNMGQMHGQKYAPRLLELWENGSIDPAFVFTHRLTLDEAPRAYELFKHKADECVKVLITPS